MTEKRQRGLKKGTLQIFIILFLFIAAIVLFLFERSEERERESFIGRFREFNSLAEEYRMIKADVADVADDATVELLPSIKGLIDSIGLNGKVKSLKMIGSREFKEIVEEMVEAEIERLTVNELINLLYGIESHTAHLSIKDIRMKKDFENPERINLNIKVSFYKKAAKGHEGQQSVGIKMR